MLSNKQDCLIEAIKLTKAALSSSSASNAAVIGREEDAALFLETMYKKIVELAKESKDNPLLG